MSLKQARPPPGCHSDLVNKRPKLRDITEEINTDSSHLVNELLQKQPAPSRGPISFAGFVTQQQEQESSCGQRTTQAVPLRTFVDIASCSVDAPPGVDLAVKKESLRALNTGSFSFRPTLFGVKSETSSQLPGSRGAGGTDAGGTSSQAPDFPELSCSGCDLPVDWGLKVCLHITSRQPLAAIQAALRCTPQEVLRAETAFMGSDTSYLTQDQERLHASICSWRHPDSCLPPAAVAALASTSASAAGRPAGQPASSASATSWMSQRRAAWGHAFLHAYDALRHGHCPALYVVTAQRAAHPQVALFCAAGVRGCQVPHAVVSQTHRSLRQRLGAALGSEVVMPLAAQQAGGRWSGYRDDGPEKLPVGRPTALVKDDTPGSAVVLVGWRAMHALFDALRAEHCGSATAADAASTSMVDVPTLLSPVHFAGAALHKPTLRCLGVTTTGVAQHKVELRGLLPPWTLYRMLAVLADTQPERDITLQAVQSEGACAGGTLNLEVAAATAVSGAVDAHLIGLLGGEAGREVACWGRRDARLSLRCIKRVVCSKAGDFTVSYA